VRNSDIPESEVIRENSDEIIQIQERIVYGCCSDEADIARRRKPSNRNVASRVAGAKGMRLIDDEQTSRIRQRIGEPSA
jgi:hypothetical protein